MVSEVPDSHPLCHLQKKDARHVIYTLGLFFHTCNMGMKITHIDAVFLEAWMYSCAHTGTQEAFNK